MIELTLPGMTCGGCARGGTAAIKAIDPSAEVVTDVANRKVQVTTAVDREAVKDAVKMQAICLHDLKAPCAAETGPGETPALGISPARFPFPATIQKPLDPDIVGSRRT